MRDLKLERRTILTEKMELATLITLQASLHIYTALDISRTFTFSSMFTQLHLVIFKLE